MNLERNVIQALRLLPPEKQGEVLDFVQFLATKHGSVNMNLSEESKTEAKTARGKQFQVLRQKILDSKEPLLDADNIEVLLADGRSQT